LQKAQNEAENDEIKEKSQPEKYIPKLVKRQRLMPKDGKSPEMGKTAP